MKTHLSWLISIRYLKNTVATLSISGLIVDRSISHASDYNKKNFRKSIRPLAGNLKLVFFFAMTSFSYNI